MKILVFQHVSTEHPGSFREVMQAGGHSMDAVQLDEGEAIPALDGFDVLVVMGGPMNVWQTEEYPWLLAEMAAIKDWVAAGRPYFGICLGHQLLAQACGGQVAAMAGGPEVGISQVVVDDDPVFAGVARGFPCFQWHGAEVVRLPPGGVRIATSAGCGVQALRLGDVAYGLQFHMELTETTATEWGEMPAYVAALEQVRGAGAVPQVQAEVTAVYGALKAAAVGIFGNFLGVVEGEVKQAQFPEREHGVRANDIRGSLRRGR